MKWRVEYITSESSNILVDDPDVDKMDQLPVGMGFPIKLAERIVQMHNEAIVDLEEHLFEAMQGEDLWAKRRNSKTNISINAPIAP